MRYSEFLIPFYSVLFGLPVFHLFDEVIVGYVVL